MYVEGSLSIDADLQSWLLNIQLLDIEYQRKFFSKI